MKNALACTLGAVILMAAPASPSLAHPPCPPQLAREVRIGQQAWRVAVAHTTEERERGLAGREGLAAGEGMWFVLPEPDVHGFWMRGMRFPIDLVWINPGRRVVGSERLFPCGEGPCPIHEPAEPIAYVLEINAGHFAGRPGEQVDWRCPP